MSTIRPFVPAAGDSLSIAQPDTTLRSGPAAATPPASFPAAADPGLRAAAGPPTLEATVREAMSLSLGLPPHDIRAAAQAVELADLPLGLLAGEYLRRSGRPVPENVPDTLRAAFSGADFEAAFESTLAISMLRGFSETRDSTAGWTSAISGPNFKQMERFRLNRGIRLAGLGRGGMAEHAAGGIESMGSYSIGRFAQQFQIDEMDFHDDLVAAAAEVFAELGRAARRLKIDLVWSHLLANRTTEDGDTLFSETRGNLGGAGSALDAGSLGTACEWLDSRTITATKVDAVLNPRAKFLVVPPALRMTAAGVLNGLRLGQDIDLELRIEARISEGVLDPATDEAHAGSDSMWFLLPSDCPVIELGYLDGQQTPDLAGHVLQAGSGRWGRGYSVRQDIGAMPVSTFAYRASGEAAE